MYNQKYTDHMIEHNPKLAKYYLELYMKDKDREERFNQRYIELQRLHGEIVVDDSAIPNEQRSDDIATETTLTSTKAISFTISPLDELEESIVSDMYYYRPSLILKTRTYNGSSSSSLDLHQLRTDKTVPLNVSDSAFKGTVASSPYDADTLITCTPSSTESTKDIKLNSDSGGGSPCKNDDGCMICFNSIQVGSKVGALPNCQHVFHTQCLKDWLKRRNVCPLCLDTDVATVAFSRKNDHLTTIEITPSSFAAHDNSS